MNNTKCANLNFISVTQICSYLDIEHRIKSRRLLKEGSSLSRHHELMTTIFPEEYQLSFKIFLVDHSSQLFLIEPNFFSVQICFGIPILSQTPTLKLEYVSINVIFVIEPF